jgi:hypothetical protein
VLRLHDHPSEITPARPGVLRLGCAGSIRDMLIADLLRRLLDLQRLRCFTYWTAPAVDTSALSIAAPSHGAVEPGSVDIFVRTAALRYPEEADPSALRLAVLSHHYRSDASISDADLKAAATRLERWRATVATGASHPSKPMSQDHVTAVLTALNDDLDTVSALAALERLAADGSVAPGSKFETFAHLDRIFALDLVRDVGRV